MEMIKPGKLIILVSALLLHLSTAFAEMNHRELAYAIQRGKTDTAIALLDNIPEDQLNYPIDNNGATLLHLAARSHSPQLPDHTYRIVKKLIERGADPNRKDNNLLTPMFYLRSPDNRARLLELLISNGADIHSRDKNGMSALGYFAGMGATDAISSLIRHGASVDTPSMNGMTPLMNAAERGRSAAVEMLIRAGAKINARDNKGNSPIHYAAKSYNIMMIESFLKKGVSINDTNNDDETALSIFASAGKWAGARILLEHGADPLAPITGRGRDFAGEKQSVAMHLLLHDELGMSDLISGLNIDIAEYIKKHPAPVYLALVRRDISTLKKLAALGVKFNATIENYPPPVPMITGYPPENADQTIEILDLLLKNGADINAFNKYSHGTGIAGATSAGDVKTIQYLMDKGANLISTGMRESLILLALKRKHYDAAWLLTNAQAPLDFQSHEVWRHLIILMNDIASENLDTSDPRTRLFLAICQRNPTVEMSSSAGGMIKNANLHKLRDTSEIIRNGLEKIVFIETMTTPDSRRPPSQVVKQPVIVVPKRQYSDQASLHAIGIYTGTSGDNGKPWWSKCGDAPHDSNKMLECHRRVHSVHKEHVVNITVYSKSRPLILSLMAYEPVHWVITNANNAKIEGVILSGYHGQRISGINAAVPIDVFTYKPSSCGLCQKGNGYFYAYKSNTPEYQKALTQLRKITGKTPTSFQTKYKEKSFSIIDRF